MNTLNIMYTIISIILIIILPQLPKPIQHPTNVSLLSYNHSQISEYTCMHIVIYTTVSFVLCLHQW